MIETLKNLPSVKRFITKVPTNPSETHDLIPNFVRPKGIILYGIEMEIGPDNGWSGYGDLAKEIRTRMGNYVAIHHDCGAVEVDSPPLLYSEAHVYLDCLLGKELKHAAPKATKEWGMHIHVSKQTCAGEHLLRLLYCLSDPEGKAIFGKLAERSVNKGWGYLPSYKTMLNELTRYAKAKASSDGKVHTFEFDFERNILLCNTSSIESARLKEANARVGIAINTQHDTHEFRLFKSTTDVNKAKANLQTVKALIDFTRYNKGNGNTWLRYVADNPSRYPHLYSWMVTKKLL